MKMIILFWEVDLPTDLSAEGFVLLGDYTEDDWTHRYFLYTRGIEEWENARDRAETLDVHMFIPNFGLRSLGS